MKRMTAILIFLGLAWLVPMETSADIYMVIDSNGVLHFTNVPTSSDYKLYIRERPKPAISNEPSEFDPHIKKASEVFGINFHLIKAVIKAESDFNPEAVSKKGAKGLMQIMPSNFKSLGVSDPFDPFENIMAGTRYLGRLMNRYQGKLPLVLAAYNAGPDAVDQYNSIPPFPETRSYVSKVMKFFNAYKASG